MEPNEHLVDRIEEKIIKDLAQYYSIEIKENKLVDALRIINELTGSKMILIIDEWDAMSAVSDFYFR